MVVEEDDEVVTTSSEGGDGDFDDLEDSKEECKYSVKVPSSLSGSV